MSNDHYAQSSATDVMQIPLTEASPRKWSRQWFITSILLGPAIGLTVAAILFYLAPKKYESKAEMHYASLHAGQQLDRQKLEAEERKLTDANNIAEIEASLLQREDYRTKQDMPSVDIETQIKGEIIYLSVKHQDIQFARDVANLMLNRQKDRLTDANSVDQQVAEGLIEQAINEQKKLPAATQELLQLQSRLDLLHRAQDRHEMLVAYAAEPTTFRDELLAYQRDYLKPETLRIDSTNAEFAKTPGDKELDKRWLRLIGKMERHRKELLAAIEQRKASAPDDTQHLAISADIQQPGIIVDLQHAELGHMPDDPKLTSYLVSGSVTGLLLLPLLSLLGFVRSHRQSLQSSDHSETP